MNFIALWSVHKQGDGHRLGQKISCVSSRGSSPMRLKRLRPGRGSGRVPSALLPSLLSPPSLPSLPLLTLDRLTGCPPGGSSAASALVRSLLDSEFVS